MKNTHSNRNSSEIRPIWYLAQGQQSVPGTTPSVASYAVVGETTAP